MSKIITCAVLGAYVVALGGCFPFRRPVEPQHLSLKDDIAKPPRASADAPSPKATTDALPPKPKPTLAIEEKARAEQWARCAQRHVDYQAGKLNESEEQKRTRDEICAELHRTDHARQ
jgi:hypothetical protein